MKRRLEKRSGVKFPLIVLDILQEITGLLRVQILTS